MNIQRLSPEETRDALEGAAGWTYLDVRSRGEFAAGHVAGAINIPLLDRNPSGPGLAPNPNFLEDVRGAFAADAKLITGCRRGGRTMRAAQILVGAGFTDVVDMRGGIDGELDGSGQVVYPGWGPRGLPLTTQG